MLGELLSLGQVHCCGPGTDELLLGHPFECQPVPSDPLDVLGPGIDQRHVEPVMGELTAGIAADGTGADDGDAFLHDLLPLT